MLTMLTFRWLLNWKAPVFFSKITLSRRVKNTKDSQSFMDQSPGPKNLGPLIGAIDQGTSSSRFLVFTSSGELVTYHQVPISTTNPKQGWAEQEPLQLLESVVQCIDAAVDNLKRLDVDPQDIVTVGEPWVFLNKLSSLLCKALVKTFMRKVFLKQMKFCLWHHNSMLVIF